MFPWWLFVSCIFGNLIEHQIIDDSSITTGIEHSCALDLLSDNDIGGRVVCWGSNGRGQSSPPKGTFIQISAGRFHTCGVKMDETVECWGGRGAGTTPKGLFNQISAGDFHTCGVLKDGTITCWGQKNHDQTIAPTGKFVQVSCGVVYKLNFVTTSQK